MKPRQTINVEVNWQQVGGALETCQTEEVCVEIGSFSRFSWLLVFIWLGGFRFISSSPRSSSCLCFLCLKNFRTMSSPMPWASRVAHGRSLSEHQDYLGCRLQYKGWEVCCRRDSRQNRLITALTPALLQRQCPSTDCALCRMHRADSWHHICQFGRSCQHPEPFEVFQE